MFCDNKLLFARKKQLLLAVFCRNLRNDMFIELYTPQNPTIVSSNKRQIVPCVYLDLHAFTVFEGYTHNTDEMLIYLDTHKTLNFVTGEVSWAQIFNNTHRHGFSFDAEPEKERRFMNQR